MDLTELREQQRLSGLLDGSLAALARAKKAPKAAVIGGQKTPLGRFRKGAGP
jgi:hypothetical protein